MTIPQIDKELTDILELLIEKEAIINAKIADVHEDYQLSAKNLYRYLHLRSSDLRTFHDILSDLGVSSLRSSEGYVLNNLYQVVKNLRLIQGTAFDFSEKDWEVIGYSGSKELLKQHANHLFSDEKGDHFTRIMVTLPNEAADDKNMIREMVVNGMDIARINLSHGDTEIWEKMITFIREIEAETHRKISIYMDLSGPKIRTGGIQRFNKKGEIRDFISIRKGEQLILTKRETLGRRSIFGDNGEQFQKAEVGILLPQIIDDAQVGDVIYFDDGMIKSKVIDKRAEELEVIILETFKSKLASHKGINLPNTKLNLPSLTEKDIELLPFVCQHADIVGYSFVRTREDVRKLYAELAKNNAPDIGVVFKIENQEAFENLPDILLEGMMRNKIGVMIARGDLAVEIGFERISEVQNQILWLCEAAHIPVIWATQVLENLAKTGIPTRAEISDAAQSAQAECVMLNKGAYINDAIKVLNNVLLRMQGHLFKKKNELRMLHVAKGFVEKNCED